jgi:hypothetical protein
VLTVDRSASGSSGPTGAVSSGLTLIPSDLTIDGASLVLRLHVFVDASIVEAFVGESGFARLTSRV